MRPDGTAEGGMRVIGTLLRGTLWECTALPEIRTMAARFARELPFELGRGRKPGSSARPRERERDHIDMAIRQFGV